MDYQAIKKLSDIISEHEHTLKIWNDDTSEFYIEATKLIEEHKDLRVRDITYQMVTKFNKRIYELYSLYFQKTVGMAPDDISTTFISKAKECKRCLCSGRFYPSSESVPDKYYGYAVTIKDNRGYTNLLLNSEYDENCYVLESELPKINPTNVEQLALRICGYSLHISTQKSRHFRTDY